MTGSHKKMEYLLVGAGCFGASTALYLKRSFPTAKVALIDRTLFPCPSAAAHDLNKIVRAEYEDPLYLKLALEALEVWRSDPIFKPWYHETGLMFASDATRGNAIIDNYEAFVGKSPAVMFDPAEAKSRFGGIFRDADWSGVSQCTFSPNAGWADAEQALRSVIQAAIDLGVEYISATVSTISFDGHGACTGVKTSTGERIEADHTVMCTGAYTAELLAESAPERNEMQVDGRMVAAAACMGIYKVPQDQMWKFEHAPCVVFPESGYSGESIPAGPAGLVKCTHELSFTNKVRHQASKQLISVPPKRTSQMTWSHDVPAALKGEVLKVKQMIYGTWLEDVEPESYRMCWDAVTPNQDFVICEHPHSKNLHIAGGGSFHGWKFMANIGQYVVQMLHGELDEEKMRRWAWNRSNKGGACVMYIPVRDLKDIEQYAGSCRIVLPGGKIITVL